MEKGLAGITESLLFLMVLGETRKKISLGIFFPFKIQHYSLNSLRGLLNEME